MQMTDLTKLMPASSHEGKPSSCQEDSLQTSAWERAVQALLTKLPEPEEVEKEKGGFWTQREQSREEFMELQQKAAARQRLLMKLRNGGHLSPAEVLMGLL